MDLLGTILRAANAEKYIKQFREHSVDSATLRILTDDDLIVLGVEDETTRKSILSHTENLQIPSEKNIDLIFDNEYVHTVLEQMNLQLNRHLANISCANLRKDVVVCDIQLTPAVCHLQKCVLLLEDSLNAFEAKMIPTKKKKKKRSRNYLFPTIVATAVLMFMCRKYVLYYR